ncbi:MAG: YaiO family outer membrane beta-barrel protein [Bacteroidia bacterium]|nr:YaiO family outer membrane beta-barrel protein [Bacteroidia bacterium]
MPLVFYGQEDTLAVSDPDKAFMSARKMAFEGNYEAARPILQDILVEYPEYSDVRNLLAKTYCWEGRYDEARIHFNRITLTDKKNLEVWIADINNELYDASEIVALNKVSQALEHLPNDPELLFLKKKIDERLLKEALPAQEETVALSRRNKETGNFKHTLGLISNVDIFDQVYDAQYLAGIEYQYQTKIGKIIPRISYANRFQKTGMQYEIDAYPQFDKKNYLYLNYGYSASNIFPSHRAGAELYRMISKTMEMSAGLLYIDFRESAATMITGSAGLYSGNYYFSARPYLTPRSDNPMGYAGSLLARKYGKTGDNYLGLILSLGVSPESQQLFAGETLLSESILYVESQQILMEYQFTGKSVANLYKANLGLTRQEFLSQPGAYFLAMTVGFRYNPRF